MVAEAAFCALCEAHSLLVIPASLEPRAARVVCAVQSAVIHAIYKAASSRAEVEVCQVMQQLYADVGQQEVE